MKKVILLFSVLVLFLSSSNLVASSGLWDATRSYIGINFNGTVQNYTMWNTTTGNFAAAVFGEFNSNSQTFGIEYWDIKTYENGGSNITGAILYYRIYPSDGSGGSFTGITGSMLQDLGSGNEKWGKGTLTSINISSLSNSKTYIFEVYIQVTSTDGDHYDSNGGGNYKPTFSTNAAFPVELNSFSAKQTGNNVTLNWKTATETNNYGFEVQKSSDNSSWNKIGFVQGAGNSNSPKEYSYTDKLSNLNGKFYYRLKQMDNDGTISYSKVVEVENLKPSVFNLSQNYPNPFNPSTVIKYQIPVDSRVSVKVYNVLGNVVATLQNGFQTAGEYSVRVDGSNLASGVYFYKIEAGEFSATKKMLLTK